MPGIMESKKKNLTSSGHVSCQPSLDGDSLVFTWKNWADLTSFSLGENSQHLSVGSLLRGPEQKMVCDLVLVLGCLLTG